MSIKKLDINLLPDILEDKYKKERIKYIAEYTEYAQGRFTMVESVNKPDVGEAKWNNRYPSGYKSWLELRQTLNDYGHQAIIDKVNELVDYINKK